MGGCEAGGRQRIRKKTGHKRWKVDGSDMILEVKDMTFGYETEKTGRKKKGHKVSFGQRQEHGKTMCFQKEGSDLTKKQIYQNFHLTLHSGERLGIMAPSGFGKTTLCKVLAGYIKPLSGQVLLDQKPLESYTGYCPVQMIWQHPDLAVNPRFRIKDILAEGGPVEERILKELGIQPEWMTRFCGELSGGELQRCCIARALGAGTRFLLADEITTMLDLVSQKQIWEFLLRETKRRDLGLLIVSHQQELLDELCTRQIDLAMGGGCIIGTGCEVPLNAKLENVKIFMNCTK